MSEILYYDHPTVVEASAQVVSCTEKDGKYSIVLSKTMIFPEGGGQLPDGGTVFDKSGKKAQILDCQTVNGEIVHTLDMPFAVGENVTIALDIEKRLDHSEQHTGEHILSGLASKLFNAHNVGFHMAEEYCTIDLDIPLTPEQLKELELSANRVIRADLPIHTEITDGEDASKRTLRKRAEKAAGEVRIVYIDNGKVDSCTCCGTHLHTTGMVGAIRITDSQSYKGGTRLTFSCGQRAAELGYSEHASLTLLARQYSTSRAELPAAIKKQIEDIASLKSELKQKSALLGEKLAKELIENAVKAGDTLVMVKKLASLDANDLKTVLDCVSEEVGADKDFIALLFCTRDRSTDYRMACSKNAKLSMKELCSSVNASTCGKGGGGAMFAQGKSERAIDDDTVRMLENYIISAVKN